MSREHDPYPVSLKTLSRAVIWRLVPVFVVLSVAFMILVASRDTIAMRIESLNLSTRLQSARGENPKNGGNGQNSNIHPTQNRTLGFGAILMAVLPSRTDQRDTVSLTSHYTEIDITIMDGKTEVLHKTLPPGPVRDGGQIHGKDPGQGMLAEEIGCWRAHMDMLKYVVDNKLDTALLLEADADWDVRIKEQLQRMSKALPAATKTAPYGLDWMVFWLGACSHRVDMDRPGKVVDYADDTAGDVMRFVGDDKWNWITTDLNTYNTKNNVRIVHRAHAPVCLASYAVTLEGARRMLYEIGLKQLGGTVDGEFIGRVANEKVPALIVVPPLMSQWKSGDMERDSDLRHEQHLGDSSGPHIVKSIHRELRDLITRKGLASDWADDGKSKDTKAPSKPVTTEGDDFEDVKPAASTPQSADKENDKDKDGEPAEDEEKEEKQDEEIEAEDEDSSDSAAPGKKPAAKAPKEKKPAKAKGEKKKPAKTKVISEKQKAADAILAEVEKNKADGEEATEDAADAET